MTEPRVTARASLAALAVLLLASMALSCWTTFQARVYLPAADVWQHTTLIEQAANGQLDLASLANRHNGLHFIPLPKLVYALDLLGFAGSGVFTALVSLLLTAVSAAAFAALVARLDPIPALTRAGLALLAASWLTSALQWESFANPANLQWSGLNAGLALAALGVQTAHPVTAGVGLVLALGCGSPWWLLLTAALAVYCTPQQRRWTGAGLAITVFAWETLNALWWQRWPPLPVLALHQIGALDAPGLQQLRSAYLNQPAGFYAAWLGELLAFLGQFSLPGLTDWLPHALLPAAGALAAALAGWLLARPGPRSLQWLLLALWLTGLAAGLARSHLPGAYTLRFANAGLLLLATTLVSLRVALPAMSLPLWRGIAFGVLGLLVISSVREAAAIAHDSNQRRLSQVAYALDIQDMRATSETPYAPLMADSFRQIHAAKGLLAHRGLGIYGSPEHRVFLGIDPLPGTVIACEYRDITSKPLRDDPLARKLAGQALSPDGKAMTRVLLRDPAGQAIGYGIGQLAGRHLLQQWREPARWAGFARPVSGASVEIIAYSAEARCQPVRIDTGRLEK